MSLAVAATGPSALWYLTRSSGLILLAVLTASVALGILNKSGWTPPGWPRFVMGDLHRNLALLGVALLAIHIITAELDPFAPVGWLAAVVPFLSPYRPLWLGLGTLGVDVLIAVIATSLLRSHLSLRLWRLIHWLTYLAWPMALLHSLGAGTDTRLGWVLLFDLLCLFLVVGAVLYRVWRLSAAHLQLKWSVAAVALSTALAVAAFAAVGPLRPGWARSAGTPTALLATGGALSSLSGVSPGSHGQLVSFAGTFAGTLIPQNSTTTTSVEISGTVRGGPGGTLRVTLTGVPLPDGGVNLASGRATYRTASTRQSYTGQLTALQGNTMVFRLTESKAQHVDLQLSLQAAAAGSVSGTVVVGGLTPPASSGGSAGSGDSG